MDTFTTLWNRLLNRAQAVGPILAQDLVRDAFQQLQSRREWSWLMKTGAFYPSVFYQAGTISIASGNVVTGAGTAWTQDMIGSQIRGGAPPSILPTYTILQVLSATSLLIDRPWVGPALSGASYQIFQCYFAVPSDFASFVSLVSVTNNYQLHTNVSQAQLNLCDAQRVNLAGNSYAASFLDYTQNFQGTVGAGVQVHGTGPAPIPSTSYGFSFPADEVYSIEITTGGQPGGALAFQWRENGGPAQGPIAVADSNAIDLANGVSVYWPQETYILGDAFAVPCKALSAASQARYELWPRPVNTPYVYPYLYRAVLPALSDEQPQLPPLIAQRGDVLLEMALANCARTPGTAEMPNPYFNPVLAQQHDHRADLLIEDVSMRDDEVAIKDLSWTRLPFAPAPWLDASFLQSHGWPGYPALIS